MCANRIDPTFLVGVMHVNREPWISIVRDGQIPTWALQTYKKFEVIYFHSTMNSLAWKISQVIESLRWTKGRYASYAISYTMMAVYAPWRNFIPKAKKSSTESSGVNFDSVIVNFPEMTSTIRWKKLAILRHFLDSSKADYLVITNSSSVINFRALVELLVERHEPGIPLYAGPLHTGYDGAFVSGSLTLLDRTAAEILLKGRSLIPLHVMDDIGFGTAFDKLNVAPTKIDSLIIGSEEDLNNLSDNEIREAGHFRLKSGNLKSRNDVVLANKLIQRLVDL